MKIIMSMVDLNLWLKQMAEGLGSELKRNGVDTPVCQFLDGVGKTSPSLRVFFKRTVSGVVIRSLVCVSPYKPVTSGTYSVQLDIWERVGGEEEDIWQRVGRDGEVW